MHVDIIYPLAFVKVFLMVEVVLSIISASCAQLVKMLIILEPHFTYLFIFLHCPVTGLQNGDEALSSLVLAGQDVLVKMRIILESHHIF